MGSIQQEQLNRFFEAISNSKLVSELSQLTVAPDAQHWVGIQKGSNDAEKISIETLRGAIGSYNPNNNTPNLSDGNSLEKTSYIVSEYGLKNFGSGLIELFGDDVIEYRNGKWGRILNAQSLLNYYTKNEVDLLLPVWRDTEIGFPAEGSENVLYIEKEFGGFYKWLDSTEEYKLLQKPKAITDVLGYIPVDQGGNTIDTGQTLRDAIDANENEITENTDARHSHLNKPTLDNFGEDVNGLPTYNGVKVDTTIAQRDVYDGLNSTDNTISLAANRGKELKDVQDSQQTAINLNTVKETNIGHPLVETAVPINALFTDNDTVYTHPATHPATIINQTSSYRFVTDAEKATWNGKEPLNVAPIADDKVAVFNSDGSKRYEDYGGGGSSLLTKTKTYTSGAQTITADFDIVQVSSLVVGNSFLQEGTQFTVSGAVVTITDTLTSGAVIQLKYWKANAVNATNYTKAEADSQFAKSIEISQEGYQSLVDNGNLEQAFYFTT